MLTNAQVETFKRDGFLIVKDFFSQDFTDHWKTACARKYGLARIEQWGAGVGSAANSAAVEIAENYQLRHYADFPAILDQLGCGAEHGNPNLIFRPPIADPAQHALPETGHIDLIFQVYDLRFTLGTLFYLNEIGPSQGGLCVWPGSHHGVWRFFQENPDLFMVGKDNKKRHEMEQKLNTFQDFGSPVELTAAPGDLILWHAFLLHEASPNIGPLPRLAVFGRWGQTVAPEAEIESFGDLWENWAVSAA